MKSALFIFKPIKKMPNMADIQNGMHSRISTIILTIANTPIVPQVCLGLQLPIKMQCFLRLMKIDTNPAYKQKHF